MLIEAEKQRKIEIEACESFTRCRYGKGTAHNTSYQYMDIDTGNIVEYSEFQQRYLYDLNTKP